MIMHFLLYLLLLFSHGWDINKYLLTLYSNANILKAKLVPVLCGNDFQMPKISVIELS